MAYGVACHRCGVDPRALSEASLVIRKAVLDGYDAGLRGKALIEAGCEAGVAHYYAARETQ
jgi:hypothetical protein